MIGELAAGLLLGPSVFGHLAPGTPRLAVPGRSAPARAARGPGVDRRVPAADPDRPRDRSRADPAPRPRHRARRDREPRDPGARAASRSASRCPTRFVGGATERHRLRAVHGHRARHLRAARDREDPLRPRPDAPQRRAGADRRGDGRRHRGLDPARHRRGPRAVGHGRRRRGSRSRSPASRSSSASRSRSGSARSTRCCARCACGAGARRGSLTVGAARRRSRRAPPPTRSGSRRCSARSSRGSCSGARASTTPTSFDQLDGVTRSFFAPLFFATAGLRVDLGLLRDPERARLGRDRGRGRERRRRSAAPISARASPACRARGARARRRPQRARRGRDRGRDGRPLARRAEPDVVRARRAARGDHLDDGAAAAARSCCAAGAAPRRSRRGSRASAQLGGNLLVRDDARAAAEPRRPELGARRAPRRSRLARGAEVTVLSAGARRAAGGPRARARGVRAAERAMTDHVSAGKEPLARDPRPRALGYGAIAVGATDTRRSRARSISPVVDELLASSPLPVIMVRRGEAATRVAPLALPPRARARGRHAPGRAAQEVAFGVARRLDAHVLRRARRHDAVARRASLSVRAEDDARPRARRGRRARRRGGDRARARARRARRARDPHRPLRRPRRSSRSRASTHVDLLVLAANLRQFTGRPFLGHGVEYLLEECRSTIVVVTLPPGWSSRRG